MVPGNPEELRFVAAALANTAEHLANAAALSHRSEVAKHEWWGPMAEAHRTAVDSLAGALGLSHDLLRDGAAALRAYAADLEDAQALAARALANQEQADEASAKLSGPSSESPALDHLADVFEHHQAQAIRWNTAASQLAAEAAVRARTAFTEVAAASSSPLDATAIIKGPLSTALHSLEALDHHRHGWSITRMGMSFASGLFDGSVGLVDSLATMGFDLPDLIHGRGEQWLGRATPLLLVQGFEVIDSLSHAHFAEAGRELLPNPGDLFPLNRSMLDGTEALGEETLHHPGAVAGSIVDWGDLSKGRYSHWVGEVTPTAVAVVLTDGDGAALRSLRRLPGRLFGPANGGLGELLPVPGKDDPGAIALARKIGGVPQVRFAADPREFDCD